MCCEEKDEGGTRNDFLIFFSPDAFMTAISVLVPIFQLFSALKSLKDT